MLASVLETPSDGIRRSAIDRPHWELSSDHTQSGSGARERALD